MLECANFKSQKYYTAGLLSEILAFQIEAVYSIQQISARQQVYMYVVQVI